MLASYALLYNLNEVMFNYIYSLAPLNYDWNYNLLATDVIAYGNKQNFDYIRSLAPPNYLWNYENLIKTAIDSSQLVNYVRFFSTQSVTFRMNSTFNKRIN